MAQTPQIPVLICCERDGYRVGGVAGGEAILTPVDMPREASVAKIAERLSIAVGRGRRVVVGLPSMGCLVAAVRTDDLPRKHKRQAMLYRMEEHLPIAAEDLAADFVDLGERALGIAVPAESWSPLLDALRQAGVQITAVCPTALLALQSYVENGRNTSKSSNSRGRKARVFDGQDCSACDALLWQDGDRLDLFLLSRGQLSQWYVLPAEVADVALVVRSHSARSPGAFRMAARSVNPALLAQIRAIPGVEVHDPAPRDSAVPGLTDAAVECANAIVNGRRRPLVDLCHDDSLAKNGAASASNPVRALVAAAICCLCVAVALFWRATRYSAQAGRFEAEKRAVFDRLFPGQAAPVGVVSRLRSVEDELRGSLSADAPLAAGPPVLAVLHETLAHLPSDVRCRWTEMRFDPGALGLEGEVLHHADAGAIAAALRKARLLESFVVDEPQTRQLDGGVVGFSISASLRAAARAEGGAP